MQNAEVEALLDLLSVQGIGLNIAGSSNGRTLVFGTSYLGSSPSPAAMWVEVEKTLILSHIISSSTINRVEQYPKKPLTKGFFKFEY